MIVAGLVIGEEFDALIAGNQLLEKLNEYNVILKMVTRI